MVFRLAVTSQGHSWFDKRTFLVPGWGAFQDIYNIFTCIIIIVHPVFCICALELPSSTLLLPGWTSSRVLSKGCQNEIKNWKIAMIWEFMIHQKLSNHTEHEISKELHMNAQTSYLSAVYFCNSPVWNIEFDELDFFPSSNWIFLPAVACKIQVWNRLKIKFIKLDIWNWKIA